jgi:hypothetical protein
MEKNDMRKLRVLVACEYSGIVRDAFIARGHYAMSCDLLPSEAPGPHAIGDVLGILRQNCHGMGMWDLMIAHPPCTRLTNSGVRWLHVPPVGKTLEQMWDELEAAADFYRAVRDAPIRHKAIENPLMHKYASERVKLGHRQVVQPWWFGEPAFKATGLELYNLPDLQPTNKLTPPASRTPEHAAWSKVHRASPGPDRWKDRSRTYRGVAEAMADQWGAYVAAQLPENLALAA